MSKFIVPIIAIVLFVVVSVYYINQNTPKDTVPIAHVSTIQRSNNNSQEVYQFVGDVYLCSDGSKIYTDIVGDDVTMALVFPDGIYGIAEMTRQDNGVTFSDESKQNTLLLSDDSATFIINKTTIKEDCTRAS